MTQWDQSSVAPDATATFDWFPGGASEAAWNSAGLCIGARPLGSSLPHAPPGPGPFCMYLGDFEVTKKQSSRRQGRGNEKYVHVRSTHLDIMRRFTHPSARLLIDTPAHRVHDMVPVVKTGRDGDRGRVRSTIVFLPELLLLTIPKPPCLFIPSSLDGKAAFVLILVVARLARLDLLAVSRANSKFSNCPALLR